MDTEGHGWMDRQTGMTPIRTVFVLELWIKNRITDTADFAFNGPRLRTDEFMGTGQQEIHNPYCKTEKCNVM